MAKRRTKRRDPIDELIEDALQPGGYIAWDEGVSFVSGLTEVEGQIEQLTRSDPARAIGLYETFIAGCTEKAEEIDDSDGELGTFAGGLFLGWIKARQAAGSDPEETVRLVLEWIDDDPYGFCNDLGCEAVKVLDRPGLAVFEREVRGRFEAAARSTGSPKQHPRPDFAADYWGAMLKAVYAHQRAIQKYIDLADAAGLTPADCETLATMFQAKRRPNDALAWVERGLKIEGKGAFAGSAGYNLVEMRRALLVKLGRGGEALDSAWTDFQAHPCKFTYADLFATFRRRSARSGMGGRWRLPKKEIWRRSSNCGSAPKRSGASPSGWNGPPILNSRA